MSQPLGKRRRRWIQFSLRALLGAMTFVAACVGAWRWYVEPYRVQQRAMAGIEKAGGSIQTSLTAPKWLRHVFGEGSLQNVVLVNVADCDDPTAYLDHVAYLPAIETLVIGGEAFADEHLRRLERLVTLRGLVLDTTEVSDTALHTLQEVLPELEVYRSQRRAIAALRSFGRVHARQNPAHARLQQAVGAEWFEEATIVDFSGMKWRRNVIDDALGQLKFLTHVTAVDLSDTSVADADLVRVAGLHQLDGLYLDGTQVGDTGLAHLQGLTQLSVLLLSGTRVTDASLDRLKRMKNLRALHLRDSRISPRGIRDLHQALPLCDVWATPSQATSGRE